MRLELPRLRGDNRMKSPASGMLGGSLVNFSAQNRKPTLNGLLKRHLSGAIGQTRKQQAIDNLHEALNFSQQAASITFPISHDQIQ